MKNDNIQKVGKPKQGAKQIPIKVFKWNTITNPKKTTK